jgi:hypothetical protein
MKKPQTKTTPQAILDALDSLGGPGRPRTPVDEKAAGGLWEGRPHAATADQGFRTV